MSFWISGEDRWEGSKSSEALRVVTRDLHPMASFSVDHSSFFLGGVEYGSRSEPISPVITKVAHEPMDVGDNDSTSSCFLALLDEVCAFYTLFAVSGLELGSKFIVSNTSSVHH